jgi:hypothetical protein
LRVKSVPPHAQPGHPAHPAQPPVDRKLKHA